MSTEKTLATGRICAIAIGITFTVLGFAGLIPAFVSLPASAVSSGGPLTGGDASLTAGTDYVEGFVRGFGYLFGIFPTNTLHNILGAVLGVIGLYSSTGDLGTYNFNRFCAIFLPLGALVGLLPITNSLFGVMPIYGSNVWVSAITGAIAVYATVSSEKPSGEISA